MPISPPHTNTSPLSWGVSKLAFLDVMRARWNRHGNTLTPALLATWEQICNTFNRKLQEIGRPSSRDWHVLSPATGAGKTESAIAYAALLPAGVGMMLVTRLKAGADDLAASINARRAGMSAIAHHSDAKVAPEVMRQFPVAVITHAAFERAVERNRRRPGVGPARCLW